MNDFEEKNNLLIYKNKEGNIIVDDYIKMKHCGCHKKGWPKYSKLEFLQFLNI